MFLLWHRILQCSLPYKRRPIAHPCPAAWLKDLHWCLHFRTLATNCLIRFVFSFYQSRSLITFALITNLINCAFKIIRTRTVRICLNGLAAETPPSHHRHSNNRIKLKWRHDATTKRLYKGPTGRVRVVVVADGWHATDAPVYSTSVWLAKDF